MNSLIKTDNGFKIIETTPKLPTLKRPLSFDDICDRLSVNRVALAVAGAFIFTPIIFMFF